MPNSWHNAVNDFSPRLAVTTKLTRCSRTSIVFHGIVRYAPALAALARKCKGCLETFCKGCHETEHVLWLEWEFSQAKNGLSAPPSPVPRFAPTDESASVYVRTRSSLRDLNHLLHFS